LLRIIFKKSSEIDYRQRAVWIMYKLFPKLSSSHSECSIIIYDIPKLRGGMPIRQIALYVG